MQNQKKHIIHLYKFSDQSINQKQLSTLILEQLKPYLADHRPQIKFRGRSHKYWALFQIQPEIGQKLNSVKMLDINGNKVHIGRYYHDYQIFINKLNSVITEQQVKKYFGAYGQVTDVAITKPVDERCQSYNHCYVKLKDQDIVDKILFQKIHKIQNKQFKVVRTFKENQDKQNDKKLFLKIQGSLPNIDLFQEKAIEYFKNYGKIRERPRVQIVNNKQKMLIIYTNSKYASNAMNNFKNSQFVQQFQRINVNLFLRYFHCKQNKIFVSNLKENNQKIIKQKFQIFGEIDQITVSKGKGHLFNSIIKYVNENDFKKALTSSYQQKELFNLFQGRPSVTIFMSFEQKKQFRQMIHKRNNPFPLNRNNQLPKQNNLLPQNYMPPMGGMYNNFFPYGQVLPLMLPNNSSIPSQGNFRTSPYEMNN